MTENEYTRLFALAVKVALAHSLNGPQAEDVAQDVLVALWMRSLSPGIQPIRDRAIWVAAAARYAAVRVLKSRRRELPLSSDPTTLMRSLDLWIDISMAVSQLSVRDQELFRLRYLELVSLSGIATRMGVSDSTVRRRVRYLRTVLQQNLAEG